MTGCRPQKINHFVDIMLTGHLLLVPELPTIGGILLEFDSETGKRERFEQIGDDPLRNGLPYDVQVARRGHGDDVEVVAGGPDLSQQVESVAVGQIQVEQDEVDRNAADQAHGLLRRSGDTGHSERGQSTDVGGMSFGGDGFVLDDEDLDRHESARPIRTSNRAPPISLDATVISPR